MKRRPGECPFSPQNEVKACDVRLCPPRPLSQEHTEVLGRPRLPPTQHGCSNSRDNPTEGERRQRFADANFSTLLSKRVLGHEWGRRISGDSSALGVVPVCEPFWGPLPTDGKGKRYYRQTCNPTDGTTDKPVWSSSLEECAMVLCCSSVVLRVVQQSTLQQFSTDLYRSTA